MRRLLLKLFRRRTLHADIDTELAFHREMAGANGNPIPLGNTTLIKEHALDAWRFNILENIWRDVKYAFRSLGHSPGFVLSALLSLGLGIGVNTAMFSIACEFLLSQPSMVDAGSWIKLQIGGSNHSKPEVIEFLRASGVFQDVIGENFETFLNWNDGRETRRIFSVQTTKNYFTALGVPLTYGRAWTPADSGNVVVLRYQFWQKHFNGDTSIIGRGINLDGRSYTVLGVLPETHRTLIGYGLAPDVYLPSYVGDATHEVYAKLKPGISLGQALPALSAVTTRMDREMPDRDNKYANNLRVTPVAGWARLKQEMQGQLLGVFFIVLLALGGLVFLIACVNVAGLLLVRAGRRKQEIAIRLSLGASRGRLLQQLLAESLLLSLTGGGLGFVLAQLVAKLLASIHLPLPFPIQLRIDPDWRVVTYAAILAGAATVACGLLPAWQSVKDSLTAGLHRERRLRMRRGLVVVQIAVSVIVLATGSLFLHNLILANATSPGFDVRKTARAEVHLPPIRYRERKNQLAYFDEAIRQLDAIAGVEAVAAARILPFVDEAHDRVNLVFPRTGQTKDTRFHVNAVSPAFFGAMGIPLLAGRVFTAADRDGARVVIVNKTFVDRYLDGHDAIGTAFLWGDGKALYQIVGVVAGTKNFTIGEEDQPQLYQPLTQAVDDLRPQIQFVIRSATPPIAQLPVIRQVLRHIEPGAGIEVTTMYSSIGFAFLPSQVGAALMGGMGVLGLLLAAIGLYGITAYSVARRTREFGVRIAVGATRANIAGMVLTESAWLLLLGSATGLLIAFFITKPLAMFFVQGLGSGDPLSFALVVTVLVVTGSLATLGPIRRALRVDPVASLRYE